MPPKRNPRRPDSGLDLSQNALRVVREATGQQAASIPPTTEAEKNPAAVALGKLGGRKGGLARAKKLSPGRKKEIAKRAAKARWNRR